MEVDAQRVVIGLTTGAVYGLLALGFVIIYRASKVLNFAEAGIGAVGAYLLYDLMEGSGGGGVRFLPAMGAGLVPDAPHRIGRLVGLDTVVIDGRGTLVLGVLVAVGVALVLLVGRTRWGLA